MPKSPESGTGVNNTQTTPRTTRFYTCTIKAHRPFFSSDKIGYTNVVRATTPENALGRFIAQFKALYPEYTAVMGDIKCYKTF